MFCKVCDTEKHDIYFAWSSKAKGIRRTECKDCYNKGHRARYTAKYGDKYRPHNKERRLRHTALLVEYKKTQKCMVCGESDIECLDFHHLDPTKKDFGVSTGNVSRNWDSFLAELNKCVCLCANDHRRVHSGRINLEDYGLLRPSATNGE